MVKKKKLLQQSANSLIAYTDPQSLAAEQFRTLRTNINFSSLEAGIRTMVVTSAAPQEGKSTTSANLSVVFAQEGKKVLLVDGNMRKPSVHSIFHIENAVGLSNVLTNQSTAETAISTTFVERLDLMSCGPIPLNPAELLSSKKLDALVHQLTDMYDVVIFDAPPILSVADGQILANKCDGTILVINSGHTDKELAVEAKEAVETANSRIIGAVLNNFVLSKASARDQYYS